MQPNVQGNVVSLETTHMQNFAFATDKVMPCAHHAELPPQELPLLGHYWVHVVPLVVLLTATIPPASADDTVPS